METIGKQKKKLPIIETTKKTYQNAFIHYFLFLKRYWFLVIIFITSALIPILFEAGLDFSTLFRITLTDQDFTETRLSGIEWVWIKYLLFFSLLFSLFIISLWAPLALAVPWHQKLITDKSPSKPFYLGFNKPTWLYIWKAIQLCILSFLPFILAGLFYYIQGKNLFPDDKNIPLFFVIGAYSVFIFARFGMILPATTIGKPMNLRQALRLTSGHTISCLMILMLANIPLFLLSYDPSSDVIFSFLDSLFSEDDEWTGSDMWLFSTTMLPIYLIMIFTSLLPLSALSHIYIALSNHPSPPS